MTLRDGVIPVITSFATRPQVGPESVGPLTLVAPPHCCAISVFVSKLQFQMGTCKVCVVLVVLVVVGIEFVSIKSVVKNDKIDGVVVSLDVNIDVSTVSITSFDVV